MERPDPQRAVVALRIEALGRFVKTGQLSQVADAMTLTPAEGGYGVSPQLDPVLQVIYANQSGLIRAGAKIVQRGINDSYSQPIATGLPAGGLPSAAPAPPPTTPSSPWCSRPAAASTRMSAPRAGSSRTGHTVSSALAFSTRSVGLRARRLGSSWSSATGPQAGRDRDGDYRRGARAFGTDEHVLSGVANSLDLDSCVNAFFKLQPEYQERASWLMSPAAFAVLRSQKRRPAGSYMMDVSISAGGPPTLLGRPVYLDVNVPAPATDALSVIVGDFGRGYSVIYYGYPVVIRDPYSVKGQLSFYAERRVGGKWMDTNAFKFIKCSST